MRVPKHVTKPTPNVDLCKKRFFSPGYPHFLFQNRILRKIWDRFTVLGFLPSALIFFQIFGGRVLRIFLKIIRNFLPGNSDPQGGGLRKISKIMKKSEKSEKNRKFQKCSKVSEMHGNRWKNMFACGFEPFSGAERPQALRPWVPGQCGGGLEGCRPVGVGGFQKSEKSGKN